MDSYIDFSENKNLIHCPYKIYGIWETSQLPDVTHSVNPIMYFSRPLGRIHYWSAICVCLRVFLFVCWGWTELLLLHTSPALIGSVWGPISQLCWRSINPDRSIVPPLFTDSDQWLRLRYHFQLEKHSWAGMKVDLKWLQELREGRENTLHPKKINLFNLKFNINNKGKEQF